MLTIGQVAAYVGVTVRAVRHYHQVGLLPEPARDASGYRRYDGADVVELIRIKTLADAGVPLARIDDLLDAGPDELSQAVADIDEGLRRKIRDLTSHRRRLAQVVAGERLFLPAEVVDYLDQLRSLGISERTVRSECDGWIVLAAHFPDTVLAMVAEKRAHLANPRFCHLYIEFDQAYDWDPTNPRLVDLADELIAFVQRKGPETYEGHPDWTVDDPTTLDLVLSSVVSSSSAYERLNQLCRDRLKPTDKGHAPK